MAKTKDWVSDQVTDKNKNLKQKQYFDVKVEALVPTLFVYRILANNENEALELMGKALPSSVKPRFNLRKLIKASVSTAGSSLIKLTKTFRV